MKGRTGVGLALVAAGIAAAGLAAPAPAQAATVDTSAWYHLVSRHSGKVMEIAGGSTVDGARLQQWSRLNQTHQQFQFVDSGGGFYRLRARHSGKVVELAGIQDGANAYQITDNGNTRQQFRLVDSDGGYLRLINRASNKAPGRLGLVHHRRWPDLAVHRHRRGEPAVAACGGRRRPRTLPQPDPGDRVDRGARPVGGEDTGRHLPGISAPTNAWERQGGTVNEGPVALQRNGRTFIVYSASACWGTDYKLGLLTLTGANPLSASSWTKAPNPVFQRNDGNGVYGPGHNGFFTSPDGTESWIAYHANNSASGGCDNNRTTRAQRFSWSADGTPNFGIPVRLGTTLDGPAGETAATPAAYTIVKGNSGKCLEVANCSTADGADVRQWTWLNNPCQQWQLLPA